ncbi:MAG TPA: acyl-ACP--UDP-N-acetylglucosamine O-acyltransferase [Alphaproteobacteria bacterium]|nr:acyl-ACP--UDP-N-acetylglucosamine O-acyltransferase [Alphaproteobacteria bacterium]
MTVTIHPSSIVDPAAKLGDGTVIGPFCVVGPNVELGEGVELLSHVVVEGRTRIGPRTRIFPFASIGHPPQDLKFRGEASELVIGSDNTIREHVTMNPGTAGGGMVTVVGDRCLFLVGSHIAHDCRVGNNVILSNNASLAGHVVVGDHAIIGGLSGVHQFVRIGEHAMIGGMTAVDQDVIPYGLVVGDRGYLAGLNLVGLKRRGFGREEINGLRAAFRELFQEGGHLATRVEALIARKDDNPAVDRLIEFLSADSDRKILQPKQSDGT